MADVLALVALLVGSGLLILGTLAGVEGNLALILLVGLGLAAALGGGVVGLRLGAAPLARRLARPLAAPSSSALSPGCSAPSSPMCWGRSTA